VLQGNILLQNATMILLLLTKGKQHQKNVKYFALLVLGA